MIRTTSAGYPYTIRVHAYEDRALARVTATGPADALLAFYKPDDVEIAMRGVRASTILQDATEHLKRIGTPNGSWCVFLAVYEGRARFIADRPYTLHEPPSEAAHVFLEEDTVKQDRA